MRRSTLLLFALLQLLVGCTKVDQRPRSPVVTISQGNLQGYSDTQGVFVYKGIPFAKPPLGKRRWAPPEVPDPWGTETRSATEYAPMCVQVDMKKLDFSRTTGSEDCLMLNIWTTSVSADAKLPVLIFLHGGAHMSGSSSGAESTGFPWYIGSNLAKKGPAVVVTIAYRVGVLGFIGHRALSHGSGYGGSGNYGHMDQIRALEWVRDNIAKFGGDPGKVMIFGHSGGATSTLVLIASPRARGLFHSAIIHSMGAFTFSLEDAERKGALVEKSLGCGNEDGGKALACMRTKSAHDVTLSVPNDLAMGKGLVFGPNVDRFVLPDTMMNLLRSGQQNQVPIIVGTTADEFTTMAPIMFPREIRTEEDYQATISSSLGTISPSVPLASIRAAYPAENFPSRKEAMIAMMSDYVYTCPARMVTRALSSTHKAPVHRFLYAHTFTSPGWGEFRAAHGFELALLFGPLPKELALHFNTSEEALSDQMAGAWTGFADTASAHKMGSVEWPRYHSTSDNYLVLDTPIRLGNGYRKETCDFWEKYEKVLYP